MARIVKKPEERRKEIIDAARDFFRERGTENVTMQDLMDKLGIAKGTIYHYFASKEALLEAVVEDLVDAEYRRKATLLSSERCSGLGALDKLRLLLTDTSMSEENERILESLHHPENAQMHARELGQYLVKLAPLYAEVVSQGCGEGVLSTEYPLEAAEFILAAAQFLTDLGFYPWTSADVLRRIKAFPGLLEAQLRAPKGSFDFLAEGL